jgi:hypothetical protein
MRRRHAGENTEPKMPDGISRSLQRGPDHHHRAYSLGTMLGTLHEKVSGLLIGEL